MSCPFTGCYDPQCPVCRFAGRPMIDIERQLRREWRLKHFGIGEDLPPVKYPEPKRVKR